MSLVNVYPLAGQCEIEHLCKLLRLKLFDAKGNRRLEEKAVVIVPSSVTVAYEQAIYREIGSLYNIFVMSPQKLFSLVFENCGYVNCGKEPVVHLSKQGIITRIYSIGVKNEDKLKYLGKHFTRSKAIAVYDVIHELETSGFDGKSIKELLEKCKNIPLLLLAKLEDLCLFMDELDRVKKDNEIEDKELWNMFAYEAPAYELFKGSNVFFYGFSLLYSRLRDLIDNLSRAESGMLVKGIHAGLHLPGFRGIVEKDGCNMYFKDVYNSVRQLAYQLFGSVPNVDNPFLLVYTALNKGGIMSITRFYKNDNLSSPGLPALADIAIGELPSDEMIPDNIETYCAPDQYSECLYAAQKLIEWHNQGYEWEELGVSVAEDKNIEAMLPNVLHSAGIPFFYRSDIPVLVSDFGQYVKHVVLALNGMEQDNIIAILNSGFSPLDVKEANELTNYALRYGVSGSKWKKPIVKRRDLAEKDAERLELLRKRLIEPIEALHDSVVAAPTGLELATCLMNFLIQNDCYGKLLKLSETFLKDDRNLEADFIRQTWTYVCNAMNTLACETIPEKHITLDELSEYIRIVLDNVISIIPQNIGSVIVDRPNMIVPGEVKCCVIVGVQEEVIPMASAFLTAEEKEWISSAGDEVGLFNTLNLNPDNKECPAIYKQRYRSAISAREKVVVSCSHLSHGGDNLRFGKLYTGVSERLEKAMPEHNHGSLLNDEIVPFSRDVAIELLAVKMREFYDHGSGDLSACETNERANKWREAYSYLLGSDDMQRIKKALDARVEAMHIPANVVSELYMSDFTSVSELENFAACPFRQFAESGLRLSPVKEFGLEKDVRGIFYHEALKLYLPEIKAHPDFPNVAYTEMVRVFNTATQQLVEDFYADSKVNVASRLKIDEFIQTVRNTAIYITYGLASSKFIPVRCEARFGGEHPDDFPPIRLDMASGKTLFLKGQIDRYDVFSDSEGNQYVRVIDYKSSAHELDRIAVENGYQLQLPVYLSAITQAMPHLKPAGALYQTISNPSVTTDVDDDDIVRKKVAEKMRLTGLTCDNEAVVDAMGESVKLGRAGGSSVSSVSESELELILASSVKHASNWADARGQGMNDVCPTVVNGVVPCEYCRVRDFCPFDTRLPGGKLHFPGEAKSNNEEGL